MIAGLLLAAGSSTRFGADKLLAPLHGVPVLRRSADPLASVVDVLHVVVRPDGASPVAHALHGLAVRLVMNDDAREGMASSIRCGVASLPADAECLIIALGDQPLIDREVFVALIARWRAGATDAVAPAYRDGRGHPVLFGRTLFASLQCLHGDVGARSILESLGDRLALVPVRGEIPVDVDTPAALRHASASGASRTGAARPSLPRMHPRIHELVDFLERQRAAVLASAQSLPRGRWSTRPEVERWSVGEVAAHLHRVERGVARLVAMRVAEARAAGHAEESESSSVLGSLDAWMIPERSQRLVAPARVTPTDVPDAEGVLAQLAESRVEMRQAIAAADGLALGSIHHEHPVLGPIDLYQWILFVGQHEARHRAQIDEVVRQLADRRHDA